MIYKRAFASASDCPGDDDKVVMWGYDKGVQSDKNLKARAKGSVEEVDTEIFDETWVGRRVHWSGVTDNTGFPLLTFTGPFRINEAELMRRDPCSGGGPFASASTTFVNPGPPGPWPRLI